MKRPLWLSLLILFCSLCCLLTSCTPIAPQGGAVGPPAAPTPLQPIVAGSFLAALEQNLTEEINLARTQPQTYAVFLERSGATASVSPQGHNRSETSSSRLARHEALTFLQTTVPLPPLAVSRGMSLGARDHVQEQGRTGAFGHHGSDGSRADTRVSRYGLWEGQVTENLSYGIDDARLMTVTFIIDDGVPDRSHRYNMFDTQAHVLGVACGPHPITQIVCVLTFTAAYNEGTR